MKKHIRYYVVDSSTGETIVFDKDKEWCKRYIKAHKDINLIIEKEKWK